MNANSRDFEAELAAIEEDNRIEAEVHPETSVVTATTL